MIIFNVEDNQHLYAFTSWHKKLRDDKEFDEIFTKPKNILIEFFKIFSPPCQVYFELDEAGLVYVFWYTPWIESIMQGVWIREDHRHSKDVFKDWMRLLNAYFLQYNVVMGITKRPELLAEHIKLGYDITDPIPNLFGDRPGWIVNLQKNNFRFLDKLKGE